MTNDYPFHLVYRRALTSGNTGALRKLILRALRAKPQKKFFTGDGTTKGLTRLEELATAVWRTFESGHVEHGRLFLDAGLPVDILLPDVEGMTPGIFWTPLDLALSPGDGDQGRRLQLIQILLAAGANPLRQIWGPEFPRTTTASHVRTLGVARAFWEYGAPAEAFVSLPPHVLARL